MRTRWRFDGWIAGIGTTSGTRVVLGHWLRSPLGAFSDVMVESADGSRLLLAPGAAVAELVAGTYRFDRVAIVPVTVAVHGAWWQVDAGPLRLRFATGRRGALGRVLRAVPPALGRRPGWVTLVDLPARLVLPGVRTRGSAGHGRREWYGAHDLLPVRAASGRLAGRDLGGLAPVHPPVRFGFGSVPRRPALVRVTTTVQDPPQSRPAAFSAR